jgi:hypothetical protein
MRILFFLVVVSFNVLGQKSFPAFELGAGRILPNYPGHPSAPLSLSVSASLCQSNEHTSWGSNFRNPETGLALRLAYLGNNEILGNQISVYPFVNFQLNKKPKPIYLKLGLGLALFNKPYDSITNKSNQVLGSVLSWHFNGTFYKTLMRTNDYEFRLGLGYYHASNGHIQIPNYGLNAFLLSGEILLRNSTRLKSIQAYTKDTSLSYWVVEHRIGLGVHELAGTTTPVGGPKYTVLTTGFNVGYIPRNHIKWKAGLIGRYYTSYYHYMYDRNRNPRLLDASSIHLMIGSEFFLGHVGLDVELGVCLYRPFFREFYDQFVDRSERDYFLKNLFNNRLGLNYYLINPYKRPKYNVKVGGHINANFGQADFSDLTVGFVYRL